MAFNSLYTACQKAHSVLTESRFIPIEAIDETYHLVLSYCKVEMVSAQMQVAASKVIGIPGLSKAIESVSLFPIALMTWNGINNYFALPVFSNKDIDIAYVTDIIASLEKNEFRTLLDNIDGLFRNGSPKKLRDYFNKVQDFLVTDISRAKRGAQIYALAILFLNALKNNPQLGSLRACVDCIKDSLEDSFPYYVDIMREFTEDTLQSINDLISKISKHDLSEERIKQELLKSLYQEVERIRASIRNNDDLIYTKLENALILNTFESVVLNRDSARYISLKLRNIEPSISVSFSKHIDQFAKFLHTYVCCKSAFSHSKLGIINKYLSYVMVDGAFPFDLSEEIKATFNLTLYAYIQVAPSILHWREWAECKQASIVPSYDLLLLSGMMMVELWALDDKYYPCDVNFLSEQLIRCFIESFTSNTANYKGYPSELIQLNIPFPLIDELKAYFPISVQNIIKMCDDNSISSLTNVAYLCYCWDTTCSMTRTFNIQDEILFFIKYYYDKFSKFI